MAPVELLIAGGGSRGATFAGLGRAPPGATRGSSPWPSRARTAASALADAHGVQPARRFADWREAVAGGQVADAAVVATLDREHLEPAIALAGQGYALLIEKPLAPPRRSAWRSRRRRERAGVVAAVAHVLRYTPYTRLVRRLLDEGAVGEIVSVEHLEPVGFWHHAHSYVRGNWRREDEAGPMLLAKCCHDLDWLSHLVGARCEAVSSFGEPRPTCGPSTGPRAPPTAAWTARSSPTARTRRAGSTSRPAERGDTGWPVDVVAWPPTPGNVEARAARRARTAAASGPATTTSSTTRSSRSQLRGRRHREPDHDRLHARCATARRGSSAPAASCAATARPSTSTTSAAARTTRHDVPGGEA